VLDEVVPYLTCAYCAPRWRARAARCAAGPGTCSISPRRAT